MSLSVQGVELKARLIDVAYKNIRQMNTIEDDANMCHSTVYNWNVSELRRSQTNTVRAICDSYAVEDQVAVWEDPVILSIYE